MQLERKVMRCLLDGSHGARHKKGDVAVSAGKIDLHPISETSYLLD